MLHILKSIIYLQRKSSLIIDKYFIVRFSWMKNGGVKLINNLWSFHSYSYFDCGLSHLRSNPFLVLLLNNYLFMEIDKIKCRLIYAHNLSSVYVYLKSLILDLLSLDISFVAVGAYCSKNKLWKCMYYINGTPFYAPSWKWVQGWGIQFSWRGPYCLPRFVIKNRE